MNFLKRLFGQQEAPVEPIFPGESFTMAKLTMKDGWAPATYNTKYDGYPNKSHFPYHVLIELEIVDKNDNGHPTDADAEKLIKLENEILDFLKQKHTVHFIARVTRNGFRDLLYYIDTPKFDQAEVTKFCDQVMLERAINFAVQKDPKWTAVGGFIK